MGYIAWTEKEDEVLNELMRQHLGARFTDIAEIATREGGPLYGKRSSSAVQGRLSKITGRSTTRNKTPKEVADQETMLNQMQEENAALKHKIERLENKIKQLESSGNALC